MNEQVRQRDAISVIAKKVLQPCDGPPLRAMTLQRCLVDVDAELTSSPQDAPQSGLARLMSRSAD